MFSSRAKDLARSRTACSSESESAVLLVISEMFTPALSSVLSIIMQRPVVSNGFLSEENRERFYRATEFARKVVHYGWIPLIMFIGNL